MARTTRRRGIAAVSGGEDQTNTSTDETEASSQQTDQTEDNSDPQNYPQDTGGTSDDEIANTETEEMNGHDTSASSRHPQSSTSSSNISATTAPVPLNNSLSDGEIANVDGELNQADTTATGDRQIVRPALTDLAGTPSDEAINSVSLQKRAQLILDKLQSKRQKDGQMIDDYKSMLQERVSSQVDRLQNAMYEMHKKRNSGVQPLLQDLQATLHRCKGLELELSDFKQRLASFNTVARYLSSLQKKAMPTRVESPASNTLTKLLLKGTTFSFLVIYRGQTTKL